MEKAKAPTEKKPKAPKVEKAKAPTDIIAELMQAPEDFVTVELIEMLGGLEVGHRKQLPASLAKRMADAGKVKIIK